MTESKGVGTTTICEALLREYLTRHCLYETLDAFDNERPKSQDSIKSRTTLRKMLGLERYASRFRRALADEPLPTNLEMLADYQLQRVSATSEQDSSRRLNTRSPGRPSTARTFVPETPKTFAPATDRLGTTAPDLPHKANDLSDHGLRKPPYDADDNATSSSSTASAAQHYAKLTASRSGRSIHLDAAEPDYRIPAFNPRDRQQPAAAQDAAPYASTQESTGRAHRANRAPTARGQRSDRLERSGSNAERGMQSAAAEVLSRGSAPQHRKSPEPQHRSSAAPSGGEHRGTESAAFPRTHGTAPRLIVRSSIDATQPHSYEAERQGFLTANAQRGAGLAYQRSPSHEQASSELRGNARDSGAAADEFGALRRHGMEGGHSGSRRMVEDELVVEEYEYEYEDGYGEGDGGRAVGNAIGFGPSPGIASLSGRLSAWEVGDEQPVAPDEAYALRQLLFGAAFPSGPSWRHGFYFNDTPGLQFGLVQREGGPCGVLAAVQAHVLEALWKRTCFQRNCLELSPTLEEQRAALTDALASILWQAGNQKRATVVSLQARGGPAAALSFDQLCRALRVREVGSRGEAEAALAAQLPALMAEGGFGVVLFLFSAILSRGLKQIHAEMDEPEIALVAAHGYCTQDLVNLLLVGEAVTNTFDGHRELGGKLLRGLQRRSRLGFLTLFEWYKYVEVGRYLKEPELPIWVVCADSHFTVIFSPDLPPGPGGARERCRTAFDLFYYDGLANQEGIIRLTVTLPRVGAASLGFEEEQPHVGRMKEGEDALVPPLEHVIATKWPGAVVDWNDTEPIL